MIHTITPGYYCVPSVIEAVTGADMHSVIIPALNRIEKAPWLLEEVVGANPRTILKALNELGYTTGIYKDRKALGTVDSWTNKFPDEIILLLIREHCLVVYKGTVYDNHTPMGKTALNHQFSLHKVENAYLVRKMNNVR